MQHQAAKIASEILDITSNRFYREPSFALKEKVPDTKGKVQGSKIENSKEGAFSLGGSLLHRLVNSLSALDIVTFNLFLLDLQPLDGGLWSNYYKLSGKSTS
jgi:hypothetical protein